MTDKKNPDQNDIGNHHRDENLSSDESQPNEKNEIDTSVEQNHLEQNQEELEHKLSSLDEEDISTDFTEFLNDKVDGFMKKQAFKKMFSAKRYNIRDGLDDYDLDYTKMEPLGDIITADQAFRSQPGSQSDKKKSYSIDLEDSKSSQQALNVELDAENLENVDHQATMVHETIDNEDELSKLFQFEAEKFISLNSTGRLVVLCDDFEQLSDAIDYLEDYPAKVELIYVNEMFNNDNLELLAEENKQKLMHLAQQIPEKIMFVSKLNLKGSFTRFELETSRYYLQKTPNVSIKRKTIHLAADLVVDLILGGVLQSRTQKPAGYFQHIESLNDNIIDYIGDFKVPVYVEVNHKTCAYGKGFLDGCDLCLQHCEHEAINIKDNKINIDYELCNGSGECASICPSGAMMYQYPKKEDLISSIQQSIHYFIENKGQADIVFVDEKSLPDAQDISSKLIMPLESLAVVDASILLLCVCYGANSISVAVKANSKESTESQQLVIAKTLQTQINLANQLLLSLGYELTINVISLNDSSNIKDKISPLFSAMTTKALGTKRDKLFLAIDFLFEKSGYDDAILPIPKDAPLGEISIQQQNCTLCLSCVSVCPNGALQSGGDQLALKFIEQNCLQCGLCQSACPENIISLHPQLNLNSKQRSSAKILNQEQAACCIKCAKPFASQKMLDQIQQKLKDHAMFADESAKRRLFMCGDCRVKDMFEQT